MNLALSELFYPIELLAVAEREFGDELSIEVFSPETNQYRIKLEAKMPDSDVNLLTKRFLNRFLELTIDKKFGQT